MASKHTVMDSKVLIPASKIKKGVQFPNLQGTKCISNVSTAVNTRKSLNIERKMLKIAAKTTLNYSI